jgi:hypothetical protein
MPKYQYTKSDRSQQQKEFMRGLVGHHGLITILINDLNAY